MQGKRERASEEEAARNSFKWSLLDIFARYVNTQKEKQKIVEILKEALKIHSEEMCFPESIVNWLRTIRWSVCQ